jgi:DNA-binding response OmpR family regulator
MERVLVIDDDAELWQLVTRFLAREGFEISWAPSGTLGVERALAENYSLIMLDVMLPDTDGFDVLRRVRQQSRTPVLMLTARGDTLDRIRGLEMGADDYVSKPFSPRELVARVKALLRRAQIRPAEDKMLRIGEIEINLERYTVSVRGKPVKLSATEFKMLLFLAERRGKVFARNQLLDAVWRDEADVEPRTVDVHIRRLRSNIEADPANPIYIKTLRGIGYFFEAGG